MSRSAKLKIVAPLCVIGGIVMVFVGFQERAVAGRLEAEGVTVPARVVGHETLSGRRGSKTYKLVVEYEPKGGGGSFQKEFRVPRAAYEGARGGAPVSVRYLPSDPSVSEVAGAGADGTEKIATGAIMGVIGIGMAFFAFRK
jgi:hypothetical protein